MGLAPDFSEPDQPDSSLEGRRSAGMPPAWLQLSALDFLRAPPLALGFFFFLASPPALVLPPVPLGFFSPVLALAGLDFLPLPLGSLGMSALGPPFPSEAGFSSPLRKGARFSASRVNLMPMEPEPMEPEPLSLGTVVEVTPSRMSTDTLDWSFTLRPAFPLLSRCPSRLLFLPLSRSLRGAFSFSAFPGSGAGFSLNFFLCFSRPGCSWDRLRFRSFSFLPSAAGRASPFPARSGASGGSRSE